jgi:hypothetical protein
MQLYESICAACHGVEGKPKSAAELGLDVAPADFSDCSFASREPDSDWFAVAHLGGAGRGFDPAMPPFGEALSVDEINVIVSYIRSFCTDHRWPRGELNLPRPLYTEKAFPEDEAVVTVFISEDGDEIETELLYEKRFGPRTQLELALPIVSLDGPSGWSTEPGDLDIGVKHNLYHDVEKGSIFSVCPEVIRPVGDEDKGFGKGSTIVEPYLAWGQIFAERYFIQVQGLGEFAIDGDADDELALRAALGGTFAGDSLGLGRAWTPMVEALLSRDLHSGADTKFDLAPQVQVTLNKRQHIMLNIGARIPVNHTSGRDTVFAVYLLWDWFDGGLFEGW